MIERMEPYEFRRRAEDLVRRSFEGGADRLDFDSVDAALASALEVHTFLQELVLYTNAQPASPASVFLRKAAEGAMTQIEASLTTTKASVTEELNTTVKRATRMAKFVADQVSAE
jgi:hypothetical protein